MTLKITQKIAVQHERGPRKPKFLKDTSKGGSNGHSHGHHPHHHHHHLNGTATAASQLVSSSTMDFNSLMAAAAVASSSPLGGHLDPHPHHPTHQYHHHHYQNRSGVNTAGGSNSSHSGRSGGVNLSDHHFTNSSASSLLSLTTSSNPPHPPLPSATLYGHHLPQMNSNTNNGNSPGSALEQSHNFLFNNHSFANFDLGLMPFFSSTNFQKLAGCKSTNCKLTRQFSLFLFNFKNWNKRLTIGFNVCFADFDLFDAGNISNSALKLASAAAFPTTSSSSFLLPNTCYNSLGSALKESKNCNKDVITTTTSTNESKCLFLFLIIFKKI